MPKISLSGPAELLTVLPYHLGFRPERSIVVVCFHELRLGLVARLDLVGPADAARAAQQTVPTLVQERPSRVVLVGFAGGPDESGDPVPLLDALRDGLDEGGVTVGERLVVRDGQWFGLDCDCCPSPGRPMPEPADVPAVAEYVAMGTAVLASREELARLVEPLPPEDPDHAGRLAAVEEWVGRLERADGGGSVADRRARGELVDEALGAWVRLVRSGLDVDPSPRAVAALVGPLVDTRLRDLVVSWLCPGFPGDHVPDELATRLRRALDIHGGPGAGATAWAETEAQTERLVLARVEQLCRATPEACAAPVLAATAAYAWWLGDGAHASFAADRALLADPGHVLATLVRAALEKGVRPPRCA
ncbi:DUF4192 domain-containing protein [Intrasporangium sp. YIM S08009]|uniref:DUF4192 domain-containing protein n=1 Tax=Intrasporangium zincisolvens TaxID=3080018 RepID=UPI002B0606A7|nr:DUF4192 domain-containing protein [Intrasporangium sp. YIM S08009]